MAFGAVLHVHIDDASIWDDTKSLYIFLHQRHLYCYLHFGHPSPLPGPPTIRIVNVSKTL